MQQFGSAWTEAKLRVLDDYLNAYITIMKNQSFSLHYVDAFSGCGSIILKDGREIDGSAIRALRYPFQRFYFFDLNKRNCALLKDRIAREFPQKLERTTIIQADCNELLRTIHLVDWRKSRGVIFLDPYAMQLSWESLENISKTKAFDVWYFFPFYALNRNLQKNGIIPEANKKRISQLLGTDAWEDEIYSESSQITMFGDPDLEKVNTDGLRGYILKRLSTTFCTVSPKAVLLRNEKHAPIFLLCFAGSNPSEKAKGASLRVANHLLLKM